MNMRVQGALVSILVCASVSPAFATQGELSMACHNQGGDNPSLKVTFTSNQGVSGGGLAVSEPVQFNFNQGGAPVVAINPVGAIDVDPQNMGVCKVGIDKDHVLTKAKEQYLPEGTNPPGLQSIVHFDFVRRSAQNMDLRISTANPSPQGNVTYTFAVEYLDVAK